MLTLELASNPSMTPAIRHSSSRGGEAEVELYFCRSPVHAAPRSLGEGAPLGPRQSRAANLDEFSAVNLSHLLGHTLSRVEYFQLLTSYPSFLSALPERKG